VFPVVFRLSQAQRLVKQRKKAYFCGFFVKQEAGKRRLAKAFSEETLFADLRR